MNKDWEKLSGYISNIHSNSKWHTESITIHCKTVLQFNDVKVASNVIINQNKINVVNQYDSTDFDRVISYEIIKDDSCHLEFTGIVIDEYKI